MKLSIIIPQYTEEEAEIQPLLASIDSQIAIDFNDFEVCIVNDCSNVCLSDKFLSSFRKIKPRYIKRAHNGGTGETEQTGIDNTCGDYIVFYDADDVLYSCLSISVFFDAMADSPDFFMTAFYEERNEDGETVMIKRLIDSTMIHGKMFRREFLKRSGIRFLPQLRFHEDVYFCGIAYHAAKSRPYIDKATYVFRNNKNSITRKNNGLYYVASYPQYAESLTAQLQYFLQHIPGIFEVKKTQVLEALAKYLSQPIFDEDRNRKYKIAAKEAYDDAINLIDKMK